jgi:hypothetical protein
MYAKYLDLYDIYLARLSEVRKGFKTVFLEKGEYRLVPEDLGHPGAPEVVYYTPNTGRVVLNPLNGQRTVEGASVTSITAAVPPRPARAAKLEAIPAKESQEQVAASLALKKVRRKNAAARRAARRKAARLAAAPAPPPAAEKLREVQTATRLVKAELSYAKVLALRARKGKHQSAASAATSTQTPVVHGGAAASGSTAPNRKARRLARFGPRT